MRTFLLMRGYTSTQKASQVIMHKVCNIDAEQIFTCAPIAFVLISCVRLTFIFVEWMTEFGGYKTFVVKNEDEEVCISIFVSAQLFSLI